MSRTIVTTRPTVRSSALTVLRVVNIVALLLVLAVNYLSNTLPLGGRTTGEISAQYPNLFTPAGLTFSIWIVIYIALIAFGFWQAFPMRNTQRAHFRNEAVAFIGWNFVGLCLLNVLWLFMWHYEYPTASVIVMLATLLLLIRLNRKIFLYLPHTTDNRDFLQLPFGMYLGWISVATIANITAWLVGQGWDGWGLSQQFWTLSMIVVATLLGLAAVSRWDNVPFALAVAWGLVGMAIRHNQMTGAPLSLIMMAAYIGILLLLISIARNTAAWWNSAVPPSKSVERRVFY